VNTSSERGGLRSRRIDELEAQFGEPIEQLLRRLYYADGLSQAELGERLGVPAGTIAGWMIRLGINQRRLAGEAARELAG
jgi:hypothetical protein